MIRSFAPPVLAFAFAFAFVCAAALCAARAAHAYPGGTPAYIADVAPYCAGCHASAQPGQLVGAPEQRAAAELIAAKHYAKISAARPDSGYEKLGAAEREALIANLRKLDAATTVEVVAPPAVQPGGVLEVQVKTRGGGGPVIGIALVDSDQRWQASPVSSAGWILMAKPDITGPDGQGQTAFTDRRNPALAPGTSYVNISGVSADVAAGKYASTRVTWRLRAPSGPGSYPIAAVLFYGTEKGVSGGFVESIQGKQPRGGFGGSSGRVLFSRVVKVQVR